MFFLPIQGIFCEGNQPKETLRSDTKLSDIDKPRSDTSDRTGECVSTVKPVYNDHPWDLKKWSLFGGGRYSEGQNVKNTLF